MKDNSARKSAQRHVDATKCETCGSTGDLQRHHNSGISETDKVRILCRKCHKNLHDKMGTWGKGRADDIERARNKKRAIKRRLTGHG